MQPAIAVEILTFLQSADSYLTTVTNTDSENSSEYHSPEPESTLITTPSRSQSPDQSFPSKGKGSRSNLGIDQENILTLSC